MHTAHSSNKPQRLRRRKPGDLAQLRAVLWGVLLEVEAIAQHPETSPADRLKAASTLATLAGTYTRAIEAGDLARRVQLLEATTPRGPIVVDLTILDSEGDSPPHEGVRTSRFPVQRI